MIKPIEYTESLSANNDITVGEKQQIENTASADHLVTLAFMLTRIHMPMLDFPYQEDLGS